LSMDETVVEPLTASEVEVAPASVVPPVNVLLPEKVFESVRSVEDAKVQVEVEYA